MLVDQTEARTDEIDEQVAVTRTAAELLELVENVFTNVVTEVLESLTRKAPGHEHEYASTFALAVAHRSLVAIAAVGDAFGCVRRDGDLTHAHLILPPRRDDDDQPGTHFVTSRDWRTHVDVLVVADAAIDAVMLSTDGLEDVAIGYSPVATGEGDRTVVRARDVYLVPQVLGLVDEGVTRAEFRAELSTPAILEKKGDDIGVAVAVRRHPVS